MTVVVKLGTAQILKSLVFSAHTYTCGPDRDINCGLQALGAWIAANLVEGQGSEPFPTRPLRFRRNLLRTNTSASVV
jgi:hypothetical protein